jgi:hypothetical protein
MSNKQNDQYNETIHQLHLDAGLTYAGINNDNELEYIGTDKAWEKYEQLYEMYHRNREELKN